MWLSKYRKENLIALLFAAYFDASGKPSDQVLTVGGAVAPVYKWSRFERDWLTVLKSEGVTEFHATDFAASLGEYEGWKNDKARRANFLKQLGKILKQNTNHLFSVGMEMSAWNSLNSKYFLEECLYSPYALCGYAVAEQVNSWSKRKNIKAPIEYIFEEGDLGWEGLKKLCDGIGINPIRLPKHKAIPCQASDLIAWKNRIAFTNGNRKFNKFIAADRQTIEQFNELVAESDSLKKMLVRPGKFGVFSPESLLSTCVNSGIPARPLKAEF